MRFLALVSLIALVLVSCAGEETAKVTDAASFLTDEIKQGGLVRVGEVRTFEGQALWEYINGGAELYHDYNFIKVVTADYKAGDVELVADIYEFDTPLNAYGLYSMLRPADPTYVNLGAEGYAAPGTIMFVSGQYMLKVIGFDDTEATNATMSDLAGGLALVAKEAVGSSSVPAVFELFPDSNRIDGSHQYWAKSFQSQPFMTGVYSQDYMLDGSRMTLFISPENAGTKVLNWSSQASGAGTMVDLPQGIAFDEAKGFAYEDDFYGTVIMGMKGGKMVGAIGYSNPYLPMVTTWLKSFES